MQKIILDTNILVSALISHAIPSKVLYDLVLDEKISLCLSEEVYSEYIEVLNRNKFTKYPDFKLSADVVLTRIREIAVFYSIDRKVDVLSDISDNKFLELALSCSADYLITGNIQDFQIKEYYNTLIMTPREFWTHFNF